LIDEIRAALKSAMLHPDEKLERFRLPPLSHIYLI